MIRTDQVFRYGCSGIVLAIIGALAGDPCSAGERAAAEAVTNYKVSVYPVQKSANNRYLIDQNDLPFMIRWRFSAQLDRQDVQIGCAILYGEPATIRYQYIMGRASVQQ